MYQLCCYASYAIDTKDNYSQCTLGIARQTANVTEPITASIYDNGRRFIAQSRSFLMGLDRDLSQISASVLVLSPSPNHYGSLSPAQRHRHGDRVSPRDCHCHTVTLSLLLVTLSLSNRLLSFCRADESAIPGYVLLYNVKPALSPPAPS